MSDINKLASVMNAMVSAMVRMDDRIRVLESKAVIPNVNVTKPVAKKVVGEDTTPIIIRYIRAFDDDYNIASNGGVTLAFVIDYKSGIAFAGVTVCSAKENFSKDLGRRLSILRLQSDPIAFFYTSNSEESLVNSLMSQFAEGTLNGISKENEGLMQKAGEVYATSY